MTVKELILELQQHPQDMNDLDKMSEMAKNNQDIRMSGTVVEAKSCKQGGLLTIGIDTDTLHKVINQSEEYYIAVYVINKKQFNSY